MKQTPAEVTDLAPFISALHLHPTIEVHNVARLRASGFPVATIKAVHSGPNALSEDAGGLESIICLACEVLTTWDSSMGPWAQVWPSAIVKVKLPIAVLIVTVVPHCLTELFPSHHFAAPGGSCSRLQLPLKLAWAVIKLKTSL